MKTIILISIFVLLLSFVIFMGTKMWQNKSPQYHVFKGYNMTEQALETGGFIRLSLRSEIKVSYLLPPDQTDVTQVKLSTVEIINLSTGKTVAHYKPNAIKNPLYKLSTVRSGEDEWYGGVWFVGDYESLKTQMSEYVDYLLRIEVVEMSESSELARREIEVPLMRDHKQISDRMHKSAVNWALGSGHLMNEEGSDKVEIWDSRYDPDLKQIISLRWHGHLDSSKGELVFTEIPEQRESYYTETVKESYEWVDEELRRLTETEKRLVDSGEYGYDAMQIRP